MNRTVRRTPVNFETVLPADAARLSAVRRLAFAHLKRWGVDSESVADAVLIADELFANAVRHGSTSSQDKVTFTLTLDVAELCIAVDDASSHAPQPRSPTEEEESGRGLLLIEALATKWGVEPTSSGKRTWACLSLPVP